MISALLPASQASGIFPVRLLKSEIALLFIDGETRISFCDAGETSALLGQTCMLILTYDKEVILRINLST